MNYQIIDYIILHSLKNSTGGCGFSQNSRFVYVSNPTEVIQVGLLERDGSQSNRHGGYF
ncbi:MAG: hypothetical protein IPL31_03995 [Saprospiraceae bacterium]|nr:hypothetical protein [Saprospiraceae bacterium]